MGDAFFRANVGACVIDEDGRVLALKRRDVSGDGGWQMSQGGIGEDEAPRDAAFRELHEETGLGSEDVTLIGEHPDWLVYELPPAYRNAKVGWGQAQKWFWFRAKHDVVVRPDGREFSDFAWMPPAALIEQVVPFRRGVYQRVLQDLLGQAT